MIGKIKEIMKSFFSFWKEVLFGKDRLNFILDNKNILLKQSFILGIFVLSSYGLYSAMKPAVRGVCRVVLQSDEDASSDFDDRVVGVEAKKVVLGTTLRQVKSIGVLKANQEVVLRAEISGKIKEISFEEGSEVSQGQELIKFEDELFIAGRDKAEAKYKLAKGEFDRTKRLYDQKVGAQKGYDEAFAQMSAAKAELDEATFQLSKTVIKAPFSGMIGIMKVSPGNIVQQHTELVSIVDNSSVKVEFTVPAKFIEDVASGQSVEISVDAFKDKKFQGTVDAVDSEVDTKNHSILVRAVIPNEENLLKHGLFANVSLVTGEKSDVMLIDEDALDREGAIEFVWVIDEKGRAAKRRVLTGARDFNGVEILAGVKEGEYVVTAGHLKLSGGIKTKILNKEEEKPAVSEDKNNVSEEQKSDDSSKKTESVKKDEEKKNA